MSSLVSYLKANCPSAWSGRIWLDIEGSQYWLGSYTNNKVYYKKSLSTFSHLAVRIGIKHLSAVAQLMAYNVEFTQVNHNGKQSLVQLPIAMEAITHYGKYLPYVCL
jgi:hypothetical protein